MKKERLREKLIDAERRAAVAERDAEVYRSQVAALIREINRKHGVLEAHDRPGESITLLLDGEVLERGETIIRCWCGEVVEAGQPCGATHG